MTKLSIAVLSALAVSSGCTTLSLERHTETQVHSTAELRNKLVLQCLATVANDRNAVPSFALLGSGTTTVVDTETLNATTTWTRALNSFSSQTLGLTATRAPNEAWTVDPSARPSQLAALHCACLWALCGCQPACAAYGDLLESPTKDHTAAPHFGVADRLRALDQKPGWLGCGPLKCVPACARYTAHSGDTWVWVTSEGLEGLAEFTLVLLDIATIDVDGGATESPVLVTLDLYNRLGVYRASQTELNTLLKDPNLQGLSIPTEFRPDTYIREDRLNAIVDKWKKSLSDADKYKVNAFVAAFKSKQQVTFYSPSVDNVQQRKFRNSQKVNQANDEIMAAIAGTNPSLLGSIDKGIDEDKWIEWTELNNGTRSNVKSDANVNKGTP